MGAFFLKCLDYVFGTGVLCLTIDPAQAAADADFLFYQYLLHLISLIMGKRLAATACRLSREYHLYSNLSIVLIPEIITKICQNIAVSMKYRIKAGPLARLTKRQRMTDLSILSGLRVCSDNLLRSYLIRGSAEGVHPLCQGFGGVPQI